MFRNSKLFEDYSESHSLGIKETKALLEELADKREELASALTRSAFVKFANQNLKINFENKSVIAINRGTRFYIYDPSSPYVEPQMLSFQEVIDFILEDDGARLGEIKDYNLLTNDEAIEFIKNMYTIRAERAKSLLSEILYVPKNN